MKVSDYIVEFFINKGVTDIFGYPGGMVTHLMDSLKKYESSIHAHVNYHEQASAFCACAYAQISGKVGVAYATSGPGATNLITGICQAYFDSIPVIFITGQVNTFEMKKSKYIRQSGFQETDIVSMVKGVTKYATVVKDPTEIKHCLEQAYEAATTGRKGPVLLDIPMNILSAQVEEDIQNNTIIFDYELPSEKELEKFEQYMSKMLLKAKRPCLLIGNGFSGNEDNEEFILFLNKAAIPVVSSMLGKGLLNTSSYSNYYGFIGAYGKREANFIIAKCDLLLCLGTRLDIRQVGKQRDMFAPNAQIIRVDIDRVELKSKIHDNDKGFHITTTQAVHILSKLQFGDFLEWNNICKNIKQRLMDIDTTIPNEFVRQISKRIKDECIITTDVGQNQVWVAQSFCLQKGQKIVFSGGHGAMGYSIPAAIGAYYGSHKPVLCFCGDGGIQMNIQELQFIARENLPIAIIVFDNSSLGMIRHFQEMYFKGQYTQTVAAGGYSVPDFTKIGNAYGIESTGVSTVDEIANIDFNIYKPMLINIKLDEKTYVYPKLEYGKPNQDQDPLLDRKMYNEIMQL